MSEVAKRVRRLAAQIGCDMADDAKALASLLAMFEPNGSFNARRAYEAATGDRIQQKDTYAELIAKQKRLAEWQADVVAQARRRLDKQGWPT